MRLLGKLLVLLIVAIIIIAAIGLYLAQYKNLKVDIDKENSGVNYLTTDDVQLRIVLVLENTGNVKLFVPPTTFDLYVDGIYAGPGKSDEARVPSGAKTTTTAAVDISRHTAPAAFAALIDPAKDSIRIKGEAHVDVWVFTLDFPFDQTFKMDVP